MTGSHGAAKCSVSNPKLVRELGALYEEITIFKRHFNTIHSTLQDAEALCAKLGQAPSFVYFDAPSFNQIVGKVSNALMDCILYCGGLDNDWIRGREPQTDLMKYFEDRFRDYNARLRYFQKPLELYVSLPTLTKFAQPSVLTFGQGI